MGMSENNLHFIIFAEIPELWLLCQEKKKLYNNAVMQTAVESGTCHCV